MTRKMMMAILILGLAGTCAFAADEGGVFIGASIGYVNQDLSVSTQKFQDNSSAWKAFGGYRPIKFFSVEGGYIDFGTAEDNSIKVDTTGWNLELVGTIPIGSYVEIYGKGGYLWWNTDVKASGGSNSTSGSDWIYGAGVKLVFAKKAAIRLEYEQYDIQDTKNVYLVSAGFEWRF